MNQQEALNVLKPLANYITFESTPVAWGASDVEGPAAPTIVTVNYPSNLADKSKVRDALEVLKVVNIDDSEYRGKTMVTGNVDVPTFKDTLKNGGINFSGSGLSADDMRTRQEKK